VPLTGSNPSTATAAAPIWPTNDAGRAPLRRQPEPPEHAQLGNYQLVANVYDTANPPNLNTTAQETLSIQH
jgi:hypothetical protein